MNTRLWPEGYSCIPIHSSTLLVCLSYLVSRQWTSSFISHFPWKDCFSMDGKTKWHSVFSYCKWQMTRTLIAERTMKFRSILHQRKNLRGCMQIISINGIATNHSLLVSMRLYIQASFVTCYELIKRTSLFTLSRKSFCQSFTFPECAYTRRWHLWKMLSLLLATFHFT